MLQVPLDKFSGQLEAVRVGELPVKEGLRQRVQLLLIPDIFAQIVEHDLQILCSRTQAAIGEPQQAVMLPFVEVVGNIVQFLRRQLSYGKRVPLLDGLGPVRLPLLADHLPEAHGGVPDLDGIGNLRQQQRYRPVPAHRLGQHGLIVGVVMLIRRKCPQAGKAAVGVNIVNFAQVGDGHILPVQRPGVMAIPQGIQKRRVQLRPAAQHARVHPFHAKMGMAVDVLLPGVVALQHPLIGPGLLLHDDLAVLVHTENQDGTAYGLLLRYPTVFRIHAAGKNDVFNVVWLHAVVQFPDIVGLAVNSKAFPAEQVGNIFFRIHKLFR